MDSTKKRFSLASEATLAEIAKKSLENVLNDPEQRFLLTNLTDFETYNEDEHGKISRESGIKEKGCRVFVKAMVGDLQEVPEISVKIVNQPVKITQEQISAFNADPDTLEVTFVGLEVSYMGYSSQTRRVEMSHFFAFICFS